MLLNLKAKLPTIVIGANTGTIDIPSQPIKQGGDINAKINGKATTIKEGKGFDNVDGVVSKMHQHAHAPHFLHKGHRELDYSVRNPATNWCMDVGVFGKTHHSEATFRRVNTAQVRGDMPKAMLSKMSCNELGYTVPHVCTECPEDHVQHKIFKDAKTNTTVYHAYWNKPVAPQPKILLIL